jgi:transcriptional regulator with XRE-family HTH domain
MKKLTFGQNLRKLRQQAKMSQNQLADKAGLGRRSAWICHIENGRRLPDMGTMIKIAKALGVTMDKLTDCEV